jgi:hypothetical protein
MNAGFDQVLYLDNGHALPSCATTAKRVSSCWEKTLVFQLILRSLLSPARGKKVIVALKDGRVKWVLAGK